METTLCLFDSRLPEYKRPFGAVAHQTPVRFRLRLPKDWIVTRAALVLCADDQPEQPLEMDFLRAEPSFNLYQVIFTPPEPRLWFYHFAVVTADPPQTMLEIRPDEGGFGVIGGSGQWQLTVYDAHMPTPSTFGKGIVYQIFPDRFCASGQPKEDIPYGRTLRSDWGGMPVYLPNAAGEITNSDYFGGDLRGIESKLDYLNSLGVTAIYLNPIFEAHSNHRYNTADYRRIDPLLGNEEDFASLCAAARQRGIRIILDGVFSHTGSDSIYFNREGRYGQHTGAYRDPESPYRSWFQFERYPEKYNCWWGFVTLPNVNELNADYLDFICGRVDPVTRQVSDCVVKKWLDLGASGFRLDVADELPDGFLDRLRLTVKTLDPDNILIGEVWEDASNKCAYGQRRRYLLGRQLDSVMNYPFRNAVLHYIRRGSAREFLATVGGLYENYPPCAMNCALNSLSTHDVPRAITYLVGESMDGKDRPWQAAHHFLPLEQYQRGRMLLKLASALQYFLPGVPCLYYGDEAGLSGYRDPFNRFCYPWEHQDKELVEWFARLGQLRLSLGFLTDAAFSPVAVTPELCVFLRSSEEKYLLCAVNRSDHALPLPLPAIFTDPQVHLLCGSYGSEVLDRESAVVLVQDLSL